MNDYIKQFEFIVKRLMNENEHYEKKNKQLNEEKQKLIEYIKINTYENINEVKVVNANELLEKLGDKE